MFRIEVPRMFECPCRTWIKSLPMSSLGNICSHSELNSSHWAPCVRFKGSKFRSLSQLVSISIASEMKMKLCMNLCLTNQTSFYAALCRGFTQRVPCCECSDHELDTDPAKHFKCINPCIQNKISISA